MDIELDKSFGAKGCAGCQLVNDLRNELDKKEGRLKSFKELKKDLERNLKNNKTTSFSMKQIFNQIFITPPSSTLNDNIKTLKKSLSNLEENFNHFATQINQRIENIEERLENSIILEDMNIKFKEDLEFINRTDWIESQKRKYNNDLIVFKETKDGFKLLAHEKDKKSLYDECENLIKEGKVSKDDIIFFE
jgi:hypothetical protein